MSPMTEWPLLYLGFAFLHLALGHFGSSLLYSIRFGGNPLVLYQRRKKSLHLKYTQWISVFSILWGISLVTAAFWPDFSWGVMVRPLLSLDPAWGWACGGVGLVGMLVSQYQMGVAFRIGQDSSVDSSQTVLLREGIYRYSRNPIYFFSALCLLGPTLWAPSGAIFLFFGLITLGMHGLVLEEENFLKAKFGKNYEKFCEQVPRYLPRFQRVRDQKGTFECLE